VPSNEQSHKEADTSLSTKRITISIENREAEVASHRAVIGDLQKTYIKKNHQTIRKVDDYIDEHRPTIKRAPVKRVIDTLIILLFLSSTLTSLYSFVTGGLADAIVGGAIATFSLLYIAVRYFSFSCLTSATMGHLAHSLDRRISGSS